MLIKIGFDIEFELRGPTPMVLMLFVHPSRQGDLRAPEELRVEPEVPVSYYTDLFGNRCARLLGPPGNIRLGLETLIEDSGEPDPQSPDALQHKIEDLASETLAFLMPSRYCEVDKLSDAAWKLFGETAPGWARVQAICDWVHNHITFGYHFADPSKSAFDVYESGEGFCCDFSQLSRTISSCLNFPAR
jgi:transglutaminase-like putative cysteine protease